MSDQDFFFDEEEETAREAAKSSSKSGAKAAPAPRKSAPKPDTQVAASSASPFEQSVSMTVAALMTAIGLLVGVIIGFVVAPDSPTVSNGTATDTGVAAPQLSEDQLNSGELPAGHPDIGSVTPTATTETPAE